MKSNAVQVQAIKTTILENLLTVHVHNFRRRGVESTCSNFSRKGLT